MKTSPAVIELPRTASGSFTAASPAPQGRFRALRVISYLCALLLITLGSLVFFGWLHRYEPLMSILPGRVSMKVNTAVLFIAAGLSLACAMFSFPVRRRWARIASAIFACGTTLLGLLTIVEYTFGIQLGVDELLLHDPITTRFPGRMAPVAAINFALAGIALLLINRSRLNRILAHLIAFLIGLTAFTSIIGYLYGVSLLYGSGSYTSMAFHTAVGFLVLAVGMLLSDPESRVVRNLTAHGTGGWLIRRILPAVILLPVALGWFYLQEPFAFLGLRFGLAIFAVALVLGGSAGLWMVAIFLNRADNQRAETERVREQGAAALAKSEHDLRLLTDLLPTLISYIDTDGRFLRVNATYERWTGRPPATIVGRTIREVLGEEYWQRTAEARNRALAGHTATFETDYPTVRGNRCVQITYAPDLDERNRVRGFVGMVLDIDDHRRAEAALRQSEKLAVVGRLASSIAHEINNPLEAVTNLLYLAEQDAPEGSAQREYVTLAQKELARVTHIVVQTLRFHRQSTHPGICQVSDLFEQVLVLYHGRLHPARIEVERRFRATHPLLCREGEVRQVLANLIGNAAEAMTSAGQPGGRLILRTRNAIHSRSGLAGVSVTVADTGHGIPPETRARLFEPFHTTKGPTGSGLGLWVSKEIVERHGGTIRVRSSVAPASRGTVFTVFFADQHDPGPTS